MAVTEFGILGPLAVTHGARALDVRGPRQRALLAVLLVHANQTMTGDRIADLLWQGRPPRTATNTLQTHVVRLRRSLRVDGDGERDGPLRTSSAGYRLEVDADAYDAARFESLLAEARRAASLERHAVARDMLRQALALWRGPALVEFASERFAQVEATRLDELRVDAEQEFAAAALACGRVAEAIATLRPLVGAHPLREQPVGHLMVALYRAGRQRDALDAYRTLRFALRDELGIDPGPELQRLEQSILDQAPNLELVSIGHPRHATALPPQAIIASPRFVGRTEELAWLGNQWHAACRGVPRLAVLRGEPGIGKTRVAAEFAERCHRGGTTVLWGRCNEQPARPFDALAGALAPLVGVVSSATSLWDLVGTADALSVRNDPDVERNRRFESVIELLERAAADAPVLLVLDDMQWADRPTLGLLAHFLRAAPPVCVLVLATVQTTELAAADAFLATVGELTCDGLAASHDIIGLDLGDVSRLIASVVSSPPSTDFDAAVRSRTAGNPFFVTELLRHLDETSGVEVGISTDLERLDPPDSVRAVIERRVANLNPAAREMLEVAAVVGSEFATDLVAAVTDLDEATFAEWLDEADSAGLAQPADDTGRVYAFMHVLVRDALYGGMGSARRSHLHERVAEALERSAEGDGAEQLARLAHHFAAARSRDAAQKAIDYSARAGEAAFASVAYEDAYAYFDLALCLVGRGGVAVDVGTQADLKFARARALYASGERARAKAEFEQVADVYRQIRDPRRLAQLALGISGSFMRHLWSDYGTVSEWLVEVVREALAYFEDEETSDRVRLLARLAEELYFSTDVDARTAIIETALEMGRRLGDARALADALNGRLRALWHPENSEDRLNTARELRDLAAASGNAELAMSAEAWGIVAQLELDTTADIDAAVARFDALTTRYGSPHHRVWALAIRGGRALLRGDFEETERLITEGMSVAPEVFEYAIQGFAGQLCTLRIEQGRAAEVLDAGRDFVAQYPQVPAWRAGLSVILSELGLYEEAREQLAALTVNGLGALRRDQEWLFFMGAVAETCSSIGAADVATECYELLAPFADRCIVLGDGYVLWCSAEKSLGLLARTAGRADDACRHLERALAVHRSLDAHPLVGRTTFEYARALHAAGRDPALVAKRLGEARVQATNLGQYGLIRSIEKFTDGIRGSH